MSGYFKTQKTLKFENNNLETDPSPTTIHSTSGEAGDAYNVGETLYFAICDNQNLNNVYFSVPECTVSSGIRDPQTKTGRSNRNSTKAISDRPVRVSLIRNRTISNYHRLLSG